MSAYDILTTIPVEIVKSFTFTDFVGMFKLLKRTENDKTPSRMRKVMAIMDEAGMPLSTTLYSYLAAAYADAGDIEGVHAVVKEVEDKKLPPIVNMDTYLGRAYGSLGKIEEARRYALLIAESRTKETSASHISGIVDSILRYANNSASDEALQGALALSQETDVLLNERAYNHIIMFYIARKDVTT
ncbi:hypothetical protein BC829DRAFT_88276 [Chytridium lagenaria]|nr:hypothetical protein BC829DRAFT_88276 [Chytridium lagenaria]